MKAFDFMQVCLLFVSVYPRFLFSGNANVYLVWVILKLLPAHCRMTTGKQNNKRTMHRKRSTTSDRGEREVGLKFWSCTHRSTNQLTCAGIDNMQSWLPSRERAQPPAWYEYHAAIVSIRALCISCAHNLLWNSSGCAISHWEVRSIWFCLKWLEAV